MLIGHKWIKKCFVCKNKGHHLSNRQLSKLKAEIRDKLVKQYKKSKRSVTQRAVDEKTWKHLENTGMLCDLCKGERFLTYPHN